MKLAIVDDDPVSLGLVEHILQLLGHDVRAFSGGEAAWNALCLDPVPMVITDWLMPGFDGLELTQRIREAEALRQGEGRPPRYTCVILLTVLEGRANYLHAMAAGADDLLTKPFDAQMLRVRLQVAERMRALTEEVHCLRGLLEMCSYCKRIRDHQAPDEHPVWRPIERYVADRCDARFSHGVCPECLKTYLRPALGNGRRSGFRGEEADE